MTQFIIFLIIGVAGIVVGYYLALPKLRAKAGLAVRNKMKGARRDLAPKEREELKEMREELL